jgi:hypothetical protein
MNQSELVETVAQTTDPDQAAADQAEACLKALREGDTLILWNSIAYDRNLRHLVKHHP